MGNPDNNSYNDNNLHVKKIPYHITVNFYEKIIFKIFASNLKKNYKSF